MVMVPGSRMGEIGGIGWGGGGWRGGGGGRKVIGVRKDAGLEIRSIGFLKESHVFCVRNSDLLTVALS